jgi:hypothetical protein
LPAIAIFTIANTPMNRQLSAAVLATFRDADPTHLRQQLRRFSSRQWQENFPWLDASGLALYLLDRLRSLELDDAIPTSILFQLEQRHADNKRRTTSLFEEFVRINAAFRAAGLEYVNLKGFTLVPGYCPDLSLRCQMDFDFLVGELEAQQCQDLLRTLGYSLMASNGHVMEFKSHAGSVPHIRALYKARPQRVVEVHFCDDSRFEFQPSLLERSVNLTLDGIGYPALASEDMFLCQGSHIFRHIRSEWTRASRLLEFRNFITTHFEDAGFWNNLRERAMQEPGIPLAVGAALRLAEKAFGDFAPHELRDWAAGSLPATVALWIDRYGDDVLLARFPGGKLYLILERELDSSQEMSRTIRRRLLPMRGPGRVTRADMSLATRFKAHRFQLWYFFFRLRFHLAQTPRYLLEAWRWKRLSSGLRGLDSSVAQAAPTQGAAERETGHRVQTSYRSLTVKQQ